MQIDQQLLQSILYEEESVELDLKREQYRFVGADENDKSELLKDVLAFANAWRRSDAFILIGVEEVKGGKSSVLGITELLDDADFQQFVNSKTQRPITLSYRNVPLEGKTVGLIQIPLQRRPFYLTRAYGRLKKETVYVRRGTSTAIADLEEISQMGAIAIEMAGTPKLEVLFGDPSERTTFTESPVISSLALITPDEESIPDYSPASRDPFLGPFLRLNANRDYYRELVTYTTVSKLVSPLYLAITNTSDYTAHDVRLEIKLPGESEEIVALDYYNYPEIPESEHRIWELETRGVGQLVSDSEITVRSIGGEWLVEAQIDKVQPKATHWIEDPFYLGAGKSQEIELDVSVFADNLPEPHRQKLHVRIEADKREVDLDGILKLETERLMSDPKYCRFVEQNEDSEKE